MTTAADRRPRRAASRAVSAPRPAGPPASPAAGPSVAGRLLIGLVRLYQAARAGRRSPCRFDPSCSAYAATALERFGAARGSWLAARRLARCHPWGGFGPDPVPASLAGPPATPPTSRPPGLHG